MLSPVRDEQNKKLESLEVKVLTFVSLCESFSGVTCQEPQPRSADQVFAFQPFC